MANEASSFLLQWQKAQTYQNNSSSNYRREGVVSWQKPTPGWRTCNIDAAVSEAIAGAPFVAF